MDYLINLGFLEDEINSLNEEIPLLIKTNLINQNKLVCANISYLKNLGVENYKEVFCKFYEVFLLDYSEFTELFEKYEKEDLIKYLKNNVEILEFL